MTKVMTENIPGPNTYASHFHNHGRLRLLLLPTALKRRLRLICIRQGFLAQGHYLDRCNNWGRENKPDVVIVWVVVGARS